MPPARTSPPRPLAFAMIAPALFALGLLGTPLPATAALMRYEYSGVITRSDPSTGIAPGTPFAGVFAYEDEPGGQPVSGPSIPGVTYYGLGHYDRWTPYDHPDGTEFSLTIGDRAFSVSSDGLGIASKSTMWDNYPAWAAIRDAQGVSRSVSRGVSLSPSMDPILGATGVSLDFDLSNQDYMPNSIRELRGRLAAASDAFLHIGNWPGSTDPFATNIDGRITSIRLVPVPEPTTLAAFGLILAAIAARRRLARSAQ